MVFSSIPLYLDPHNWHQQQNLQQRLDNTGNSQVPILSPPPSSQLNGGGVGSIRPVSMVDRARLAKLPQPEPGLNCPRCESTNTKFCYFNNYNLTQPRHFCKTCRRYWTKGGALRNVPVGGGCRKNKRSTKNNRGATTVKSSPASSTTPTNYNTEVIQTNYSQLPIMPSLNNLGNSSGTTQLGASNVGLGFGATQQESDLLFIQLGSSSNNNNNTREAIGNLVPDQWRNSQHFPFINGYEPTNSSSMYHLFQNDQNQLGLNLTKPLLGGSDNINQYWNINGGNATWTDFSMGGANPSCSSPANLS